MEKFTILEESRSESRNGAGNLGSTRILSSSLPIYPLHIIVIIIIHDDDDDDYDDDDDDEYDDDKKLSAGS